MKPKNYVKSIRKRLELPLIILEKYTTKTPIQDKVAKVALKELKTAITALDSLHNILKQLEL